MAVWAYAYEFESDNLVEDHVFDAKCMKIDVSISTDRPDLDEFFRKNFEPHTGMWIRKHPNVPRLKAIYDSIKLSDERLRRAQPKRVSA